MENKKLALLILDGWGIGDKSTSDAIHHASTPFYDSMLQNYPNACLRTDGEYVGLPEGQMGNSEVGHLNLGAGRVVYQDLVKINRSIKNGDLRSNETLKKTIEYAKVKNCQIHLMGLISNGGVHSHIDHLFKLIDILSEEGIEDIFVHAFTDGRDCDPKSGEGFIADLEAELNNSPAQLASIIGRYYAMDRDKRWERIKKAYDLLVHGKGEKHRDGVIAIRESYEEGITDEFVEPVSIVNESGKQKAMIKEGDVVICFNFRTDRCREITEVLTQQAFEEHEMVPLKLYYVSMTEYDKSFRNVKVIFQKDNLQNTLGEVLSKKGLKQLRIAETEKYPHVTFFFSGGREEAFESENRIMLNSPKVATYDLQPEMSAEFITTAVISEMEKKEVDFICLNFANADMVGHTGVYEAVVKAVETVDSCTGKIVDCGLKNGYSFLIIADHGNADYVINEDKSPNTSHTTNPVPVILIDKDYKEIKDGKLADIAPTILKILKLEVPAEMTGDILI